MTVQILPATILKPSHTTTYEDLTTYGKSKRKSKLRIFTQTTNRPLDRIMRKGREYVGKRRTDAGPAEDEAITKRLRKDDTARARGVSNDR